VIYEVHVRGFTLRHPQMPEALRFSTGERYRLPGRALALLVEVTDTA
jgi:hypothetical protein